MASDISPDLQEATTTLRATAVHAAAPHRRGALADRLWHNYGTMLALGCTTAATVLPVTHSTWTRIASGVATFLIALLRTLDFGSRWRWHVDMRTRYATLIDRIDRVSVLPQAQRQQALVEIYDDLAKARALESLTPGSPAWGLTQGKN